MRLIDADSLDITTIDCSDYRDNEIYDVVLKEDIDEAPTVEAIPISKDATNGDMIKAMFPNVKVRCSDIGDFITYTIDGIVGNTVEIAWWNAPYKREEEE